MIPLSHPVILAQTDTLAGLPATWLLVGLVGVVLLVVVLARSGGDGGRGRRRRSGRSGRGGGLPILLVIGLLIGATAFGSNVIRTVITTIVHALTTLGGLYGG